MVSKQRRGTSLQWHKSEYRTAEEGGICRKGESTERNSSERKPRKST